MKPRIPFLDCGVFVFGSEQTGHSTFNGLTVVTSNDYTTECCKYLWPQGVAGLELSQFGFSIMVAVVGLFDFDNQGVFVALHKVTQLAILLFIGVQGCTSNSLKNPETYPGLFDGVYDPTPGELIRPNGFGPKIERLARQFREFGNKDRRLEALNLIQALYDEGLIHFRWALGEIYAEEKELSTDGAIPGKRFIRLFGKPDGVSDSRSVTLYCFELEKNLIPGKLYDRHVNLVLTHDPMTDRMRTDGP